MTQVVVVEDEPDIREVVAEALLDEGYEVTCAANGLLALQAIREQIPQLVILDLMMPELDGRGFLRECRADPRCASLNVVVLTAANGHSLDGLDVQAVVSKPFDLNALVDMVISLAPA